ncbi:MAG: serine hydrolase [Clostridium sp.]|uniref:serine hydrolase n=1 Tax=Clostridium sp. TaxID=1506 RepID=UPI00304A9E6B
MKRYVVLVIIYMLMVPFFVGCSSVESKSEKGADLTEENLSLNEQFSFSEKNAIKKKHRIDSMGNGANANEDIESNVINGAENINDENEGIANENITPEGSDILGAKGVKINIQNSKFAISDELLAEINNVINGYEGKSSFYVVSMEDNMSFGYNPDVAFETASTIKAPFALYCFKEIAKGNASLDEEKIYEERFYRDGSGVLQYEPIGGVYTLKELLFYTINCSDNIAYYMIHDRFWDEGYNNMLRNLGCEQYYLPNGSKWGWASARSAALIWQEIYKFSKESTEGAIYFDMLLNAQYSYIKPGVPQYKSAHKSGWTELLCHDTGIVFAEKPYIIAVMTDNEGAWSGSEQIRRLTACSDKVMKEYGLWLKNK